MQAWGPEFGSLKPGYKAGHCLTHTPVSSALLGMRVGGSIAGALWQSELQVQRENLSQRNKVEGGGGVTEHTSVLLSEHRCVYEHRHVHRYSTSMHDSHQIHKDNK